MRSIFKENSNWIKGLEITLPVCHTPVKLLYFSLRGQGRAPLWYCLELKGNWENESRHLFGVWVSNLSLIQWAALVDGKSSLILIRGEIYRVGRRDGTITNWVKINRVNSEYKRKCACHWDCLKKVKQEESGKTS